MTTLIITHPTGEYPVHLWQGTLSDLGRLSREAGLSGKAAVVTNDTVAALYGETVMSSLRQAGFDPVECRMPAGEGHKTLASVAVLYDTLIEHGLDRSSAVIALGGGVIGDMVGFAAATYLRGVPLVQAPTTLLAMIDSSLGGKVAVDHPRGKNLIGAFYPPKLVVTDPCALDTLPAEEWRAGLAEVIKHGMISAPDLFEYLEGAVGPPLQLCADEESSQGNDWVVERAIRVKAEIIEQDPYEKGLRAVLNLGHTFAHAFETVSDFQIRHGEAVGIGLAAATRVAIAMGVCLPEVEPRLVRLLQRFGIPTCLPGGDPAAIRAAMATDKKRRGGGLRFILPEAIGSVTIRDDVPEAVLMEVLASLT